MNNYLLFIDTETTGLNAVRNDIIQVAVQLYKGKKYIDEWSARCKPINFNDISEQALKVNKVRRDQLSSFTPSKQAVSEFEKFLLKHYEGISKQFILVGHNLDFDKEFMFRWFDKNNKFDMFRFFDKQKEICTYHLVKFMKANGMFFSSRNSLESLCKNFNIYVEEQHNAIDDVKATVELYFKLQDVISNFYKVGSYDQLSLFN